ncbi:MAG: lipid-A-disaccharide synthase [Alphaproteobacteria bacterium]|nr:lipid-A-disaccharide synthase [Alphaproteobacteria bacterium]
MQNKNQKVFIIAGEVSGDVLGARIMSQMPDAEFVGIGGENMRVAGLKSIFPMSDLSVMGAVEVLAHARTLMARIRQAVDAILDSRPDVVLTIDSPGFAKSVIKQIRKSEAGRELIENGLRFHHVVAPQVWAWRSKRARKYARMFDKLYAFFDFEVPYFTKYGLDTVAVGHPVAEGLLGKFKVAKKSSDKIITLVPGSRMSEVKRLLPLMRAVVEMLVRNGYSGYKFVIPTVETTKEYVATQTARWAVKPELVPAAKRYDLYNKTYIAIVASGTVSAELAMLHVPAIVVYKMNPVTTWLVRQMIKVRWVSLVNILLGRGVYPEFLGPAANCENVLNAVQQLTIPSKREKMIADLVSADNLWLRPEGVASELIAQGVRNK